MGAVISTIIGVIVLFAAGVMSSIAASKSDKCSHSKNIEIWTAVGCFIAAIIMMLIAIFFL